MSASKRAREMSRHCPLTNASEGAGGRPVGAMLLAPSRGCRVTVGRCWTAFTAEEEKNRCHKVDDFHVVLGCSGRQGCRVGERSREQHVAGRREKALLDWEALYTLSLRLWKCQYLLNVTLLLLKFSN